MPHRPYPWVAVFYVLLLLKVLSSNSTMLMAIKTSKIQKKEYMGDGCLSVSAYKGRTGKLQGCCAGYLES